MGRRVDAGPPPAARDAAALKRRYRWLGRYLMVSGPGSAAERIRAERDRLDRSGAPVAERLAALEAVLEAEGLLEAAVAFVDRWSGSGRRR